MNLIFIYTTCKNKAEAILIGRLLVEAKLAGCVNILEQMTSIYQWEGKLEINEEAILIIKTNESLFDEISSLIKNTHSYSTPCILSIPIINGNEDYIKWLESGIRK